MIQNKVLLFTVLVATSASDAKLLTVLFIFPYTKFHFLIKNNVVLFKGLVLLKMVTNLPLGDYDVLEAL